MIETPLAPLTIEIDGWTTVSGTRVGLAINPGERSIYSHYSIGSGCSSHIWHSRHLGLGVNVPVNAVPEALAEFLKGETEAIDEIIAGFIEEDWNGSNYVGLWTHEASELAFALSDRIRDAFSMNEIATFWDAGDFFWNALTATDVLDEIGDQSLGDYIEHEVDEAKDNAAHLDADDVRTTFLDRFRELLDTYDDEIEEYGESDELTARQAATARRVTA